MLKHSIHHRARASLRSAGRRPFGSVARDRMTPRVPPMRSRSSAELRHGHPFVAASARHVPRVGELLLAHGHISAEQLAGALLRQKTSGRRIGDELLRAGHVKPSHLNFALRLQRRLAVAALASSVALTSLSTGWAVAGGVVGALGVQAYVAPSAVMQIEQRADRVVVSTADIARGYVDVHSASLVKVRTSSRAGYILDFSPRGALFKSVQVSGFAGHGDIGPDGGALVARHAPGGDGFAELHYRIYLADGIEPGTYDWPLALAVRAL
jgi:hypothetical protein